MKRINAFVSCYRAQRQAFKGLDSPLTSALIAWRYGPRR